MNEIDIAWASGVLEGEGSFVTKGNSPSITCQMTDLDVLEKLQSIFGGNIYKIKREKSHWKQAWVWAIQNGEDATNVMKTILPYMLKRRSEKINSILIEYSEYKNKKEKENDDRIKQRNAIKNLLETTNLTHREIADMFGVDRTYVTHINCGNIKMVSVADR